MKKNWIIILVIMLVACLAVGICACAKPQQEPEKNDISYMQQSFFMGKNKDFVVRIVGGTSEALFVADGQTVDVEAFVTLTLVPQHVDLFNEAYTYCLVGTNGQIEGQLDKDSFGASYSTTIKDLQQVGTPTEVTVRSDKVEETIQLQNVLEGNISGTEALEIAKKQLQDKLAASDKEREVYVKFINDAGNEDSAYYWYVAFIASPTDYYAVLVDGKGQIVSVNP